MDDVDTVDTVDTKTRNTRGRSWFGTWNDFPENWKSIIIDGCDKYVAQEETGENGNVHIQFCCYFKNARSFNTVKDLFKGAHLEPARNWNAAVNYCKKLETRTGESIQNVERRIRDPLDDKELYGWQREVCEIVDSDPDDRTIYWFYDKVGCKGKTTLAKHLCLKRSDCLYITGKASDMKYGVWKWLEKNELRTVIIDLVRSQEGFISWQGVEEIKNGIFYNTKYESEMCLYDNPHVIIFANFKPEMDVLSVDRWKIKKII